jgi:hypothetical protein
MVGELNLFTLAISIMQRARKRRISSESDLLEGGSQEGGGGGLGGKNRVHFMEELDYKMEVGNEMEERQFVAMPDLSREAQIKEAFKKKHRGALEDFGAGFLHDSNMIWE